MMTTLAATGYLLAFLSYQQRDLKIVAQIEADRSTA